mmetsp:Transcript_4590/g.5977  ORF Transcript_4590/g.5977 Transcript_4590/m.5977 type:complete len:141 (+) Transcript_4590:46-468(+)
MLETYLREISLKLNSYLGNPIEQEENEKIQLLISIFVSYMSCKFFCKVARTLFMSVVILLGTWKLMIVSGIHTQFEDLIPKEYYMDLDCFSQNILDMWKDHRPFVGEYIEHFLRKALDLFQSVHVLAGSLVGAISYFFIG